MTGLGRRFSSGAIPGRLLLLGALLAGTAAGTAFALSLVAVALLGQLPSSDQLASALMVGVYVWLGLVASLDVARRALLLYAMRQAVR